MSCLGPGLFDHTATKRPMSVHVHEPEAFLLLLSNREYKRGLAKVQKLGIKSTKECLEPSG
jgi:hypothetical protein